MERAPLPPHERSWRHPSELGQVQPATDTGLHSRAAVLAGGALAVMMVAALVITMTPRGSDGPVAVSASTAPAVARTVRSAANAGFAGGGNSFQTVRIEPFTGIPNAIAAVPTARLTDPRDQSSVRHASSAILPDLDDEVLVLTEHLAYALAWRDVGWLRVADDAIVIAGDGSIVAHFVEGRLIVVNDARVGSALAISADVSNADD